MQAPVKQLEVPVLQNDYWTLRRMHIDERAIDHYDSLLASQSITAYQDCQTCLLMGRSVDRAYKAAGFKPLSWRPNKSPPLSHLKINGNDYGVYLLFNAESRLNPCQESAMPDDWRLSYAQQLLHQESDDVASHTEIPDTESRPPMPPRSSIVGMPTRGVRPLFHPPGSVPQSINEEPLTKNGYQSSDGIKDASGDTTSPYGISDSPLTRTGVPQGSTGNLLPLIRGGQMHQDSGQAAKDSKVEVNETATGKVYI